MPVPGELLQGEPPGRRFARTVRVGSRSSGDGSAFRRPSTILFASRLNDLEAPVLASKTASPTGGGVDQASRSDPGPAARPGYVWALAITRGLGGEKDKGSPCLSG